ncbi:hypothetical protein G7059_08045 [Erysipelothrix sp. HDW6A]|uniref:hypothetical protein n=1 Tax=Erysipelothrix sp. HDW6A TaxID=2714928 RepID=UPI00140DCACE|nr:hypothetical protein [Erysipelothrix sp. HDW6A]QIK57793.1 hypothetical protein G7059_08045 [Erysipelothrix sp. HDW6A]
MAKFTNANTGNGWISEEGEKVLLKVTKVDDKMDDFGKITVYFQNELGQGISNNYQIKKRSKINEGAMTALNILASRVLPGVEEYDTDDFVGKYIRANIIGVEGDEKDEDGNIKMFYNIKEMFSTTDVFTSKTKKNSKPAPEPEVDEDEDDEEWD